MSCSRAPRGRSLYTFDIIFGKRSVGPCYRTSSRRNDDPGKTNAGRYASGNVRPKTGAAADTSVRAGRP